MKGGEKLLRKVAVVILALALLMLVVAVAPAVSAQPNKPIRYEVSGGFASYGWLGTVDSGDLAGKTGIWVTLVLKLRGGETLADAKNVYFFELWYIGDGIQYVPSGNGFEITGDVVLAGFDEGVTRLNNGKYTGNGMVTEAYGDWSDLIGCKEHCSGTIDFSDWTFTATMQINR
jgi:hypothetical protein